MPTRTVPYAQGGRGSTCREKLDSEKLSYVARLYRFTPMLAAAGCSRYDDEFAAKVATVALHFTSDSQHGRSASCMRARPGFGPVASEKYGYVPCLLVSEELGVFGGTVRFFAFTNAPPKPEHSSRQNINCEVVITRFPPPSLPPSCPPFSPARSYTPTCCVVPSSFHSFLSCPWSPPRR